MIHRWQPAPAKTGRMVLQEPPWRRIGCRLQGRLLQQTGRMVLQEPPWRRIGCRLQGRLLQQTGRMVLQEPPWRRIGCRLQGRLLQQTGRMVLQEPPWRRIGCRLHGQAPATNRAPVGAALAANLHCSTKCLAVPPRDRVDLRPAVTDGRRRTPGPSIIEGLWIHGSTTHPRT
jgi:hypothetical protein